MRPTGYLSREYAESFGEFGRPVRLSRSGGWILRRRIPGADLEDAMGIYPFVSFEDQAGLADDVADLASENLVSLTIVTDPFCTLEPWQLSATFPDRTIHFKDHHVNDLDRDGPNAVSRRFRRYALGALRALTVERVEDPASMTDEWIELYNCLVRRHNISDLRAFSFDFHRRQASVPGPVFLRASREDRPLGMHIWFVQGDVVHSHLSALTEEGYDLRAAYALKMKAVEIFSGKVSLLNSGGGGGRPGENDGLTLFKRGWSSTVRPSYLCGKIFDNAAYRTLTAASGAADSDYFPAYRSGEFR